MTFPRPLPAPAAGLLLCCALWTSLVVGNLRASPALGRTPVPVAAKAIPVKRALDDSTRATPALDLQLTTRAQRKADALANFVEGARLEENGELDAALEVYQKVLTVDPGETELASRVASLLTRQEDFPRAIDILKDAIKANPKEISPYLQLAFIYSKYLQKPDQALKFANQAIALDPGNMDAYQRIYEIEVTSGDPKKALVALDRAAKINSHDPVFWIRLGKLYAAILLQPEGEPKQEDLRRVNAVFQHAAENANDDAATLKDVADYYAATQQVPEAIPLYLRVLELQPDDANARDKLATGFVQTNQRGKAIEMLQEIIEKTPEKYHSYELLAQLLDDEGRALQRANQQEAAKAQFAKAAANYEQSLLINPSRGQTYLRLAELLLGPLRDNDRAEKLLSEAHSRFPEAPQFTYYLGIARRELKHAQQAVITFAEAMQEAETNAPEMINTRFLFDYGAAADQAGLYDKAADLFKRAIALDPPHSADACNYLAYMWAEHDMHLDEAEEMIKKALDLEPDNGAFLDSRGWINFRKGKFDDALRDLLRAAQVITRDDPTVFEHIGDTYAKLNHVPQALDYWQKAVSLAPDNKALADKIEKTKTKMSKGDLRKAPPLK